MMTRLILALGATFLLAPLVAAQDNPVAPENVRLRAYQRWCQQYEFRRYSTGGYESKGYRTGGYEWKGYSFNNYRSGGYRTNGYETGYVSCKHRPVIGNPFVEDPPFQTTRIDRNWWRRVSEPRDTGRRLLDRDGKPVFTPPDPGREKVDEQIGTDPFKKRLRPGR